MGADLKDLNIDPESLDIVNRQATINIGTIGHVAHGKSTVVKAISGVQTVRFKNELERNITIKLGYANAKIFKCDNEQCPRPGCYKSFRSDKADSVQCERPGCGGTMKLIKHVSFVDCPGHDILMATMLNGAAVMDAAFLLIAANETCPQPQTSEHLAAIEIMKLKKIFILQNKIDLIKESAAEEQYKQILQFVEGTSAEGAPIIPISGQLKYNIDCVCEYIANKIPTPKRDYTADPKMIVIRSFDINKPGAEIEDLKGGVAGGSIISGILRVGDEIEVRPGVIIRDANSVLHVHPIVSVITSLYAENNQLSFAVPGGLIGVGTQIDPTLCRADRLVGHVLGLRGKLPNIYSELEFNFFLLRRLLGVKQTGTGEKSAPRIHKIRKDEVLMVNIGSTSCGCKILWIKNDLARIILNLPACAEIGENIALSRRIDNHWRLIGWGTIKDGAMIEPEYN